MTDSAVLLLDGVTLDPTLTGGVWSTTNPLANIKTRQLRDAARTSGTGSTATRFLMDFGTAKTFGGVGLGWTNLSQWAKARIRYGSVTDLRVQLSPNGTRVNTNETHTEASVNASIDDDPDTDDSLSYTRNSTDGAATIQVDFPNPALAFVNGADMQILRIRMIAPAAGVACQIDTVELYENATPRGDITPVEGIDVPPGYLSLAAAETKIFEIPFDPAILSNDNDLEIAITWSGGSGSGDTRITSVSLETLQADVGATDKAWKPLLPSGILGAELGDSHMTDFILTSWAWANSSGGIYSDVTASRYVWVEILDRSNAADYVEIGRAMACPLIAQDATAWPHGPTTTIAHGMKRVGVENRRTMSIPWSLLALADAGQLMAFGGATYEDAQMCVIPLPEATPSNLAWPEMMPMHGEYRVPMSFGRHQAAAKMVGGVQLVGF